MRENAVNQYYSTIQENKTLPQKILQIANNNLSLINKSFLLFSFFFLLLVNVRLIWNIRMKRN